MKRGFTLIELLVVIAILAVLAVAVVLVLNPAELIKEGRDTTRISDLASVNSAVALWTADVLNTTGNWTAVSDCQASTTSPGGVTGCTVTSSTVTTGSGWVNLNFGLIASGSPLPREPVDPNLNGTCKAGANGAGNTICQYGYYSSSTVGQYKLEALMESAKFYTGGSSHVTDNDGGSWSGVYEIGSYLGSAF